MPDLLLLFRDDKACFELEELARERSFRVKSTFEVSRAADWLKLRPFDVMFVDAAVPIEKQQDLAGLLWRGNPIASLVAYDLAGAPGKGYKAPRLFGAEVAGGAQAMAKLRLVLEKQKPRGSIRSENFKILVVEDLDSPRDIICMFVEGLGFSSVRGVNSAREAVRLLENDPHEFGCVLTDIRMPDMSGRDLIAHVRGNEKLQHLPMVVLTAYGTTDTLIECIAAGASGFLVKPPKRAGLIMELSRAMRISAQGADPRLCAPEDVQQLKNLLMEKGLAQE